jgi:ADP-heptose:LPS heptosyltransferase
LIELKQMGWRRKTLEQFVHFIGTLAPTEILRSTPPRKIFVLRNNDIGDLLVITPLFEALKKQFPDAEIIAGIGSWNRDVLACNPYVTTILNVNAPWHNNFIRGHNLFGALFYIYGSSEMRVLKQRGIDVGIDVLGSGFGSLLLMRARIPYRLGVKGYAGGESAVQHAVPFDPQEHVGRQSVRFAEALGCIELPEVRPQIFLDTEPEQHDSIVVAPGSGVAGKNWPTHHFAELVAKFRSTRIILIGSAEDRSAAKQIVNSNPAVKNLCGALSLRETFAIVAGARLVICNSSMAMHAAAAFRRPSIVLLGEHFSSAAQHHAQWGYPETIVLGRGSNRAAIFTPAEAAPWIERILCYH